MIEIKAFPEQVEIEIILFFRIPNKYKKGQGHIHN